MSAESIQFRKPTASERKLLALLAKRATGLAPDWLEGLAVREMDDGGMGSLALIARGAAASGRRFGKKVAEYQFHDADGVAVLVTLTVDQSDQPFEMEVWKTDFSPIVRLPEISEQ